MKARRGVTLVEVALAGALATLLALAFMEGVIVSSRIAHENAQLLAAEAFAWDTAWKWLNKSYDDLNGAATAKFYPDAGYATVSSNDCPMLCRELNGGADARVYVRVAYLSGSAGPLRHGERATGKRIDVDVEWGAVGDRRHLWGSGSGLSSAPKGYSIPISVFKGPIERGL